MSVVKGGRMPVGSRPLPVQRVAQALDAFPPALLGDPLNLLFLEEAAPIGSAREYLCALDSPGLCEERREYLVGTPLQWPFPAAAIGGRPDPYALSDVLFTRFSYASALVPAQDAVGQILLDRVRRARPDMVLLVIVDGLSYYDLPESDGLSPCLVTGVSNTSFGHRCIVGKPSISQRLFSEDYKHQTGFTYFDVAQNQLASDLYAGFGDARMHRVSETDEIVQVLKRERMARGFVQVTSSGLDELAHKHRNRPPIRNYVDGILDGFGDLIACLRRGGRRVLACLTADHGILWRDNLRGREQYFPGVTPSESNHPRHIARGIVRDCAHVWRSEGASYSLLRFPFLTRKLRQNEWGVHGGISAWESIVPLLIREA